MATFEFKLPDIGEGIVEGEIVKWLVREGDAVVEDQPLVEVMTDKATVTIPSPKRGKVLACHGQEGQIAKVHHPLVTLEVDGAGVAGAAPASYAAPASVAAAPAPRAAAVPAGKVLATPVTRRMAHEHGLNLAAVPGTGPQGRVTKADVLAVLGGQAGKANGHAAVPLQVPVSLPGPLQPIPGDERVPLKGLRKRIAEKMVRSKTLAPHFTFVEEMDAGALMAMRERINAQLKAQGDSAKISYLPFICKALVAAMRKFPTLNANFDEVAQELVIKHTFNLGIAVATDDGLIVPVVKGVERKSLRGLAQELEVLSKAARERRSRPEDLSGGTFTITSLGQTGGLFATPIINHPEVAILGVHKMREKPVVKDGQVTVGTTLYLSLSFDHRVIDGAVGAAFTYELIRYLENPELLILDLA